MLIFAGTPEEAAYLRGWAEARIPHLHGRPLPEALFGAVVRGGEIAAVVAFYDLGINPDGNTLRVSVAAEGPHWARPAVLHAIFHYAFVQAGVFLLEVGTPLARKDICRFVRKLGFQQDGVLPHRYGRKQHQAVFSMSADQWRRTKYFRGGPLQ